MMRIVWKEWRQQRWLVLFGIAAGLIVPIFELISSLGNPNDMRVDAGSGVVLVVGAFFAIIFALATTSGDSNIQIRQFWQSKPVSPLRLFIVKFLMGALLPGVAFMVTMSLDFITMYYAASNGIRRFYFDYFAWASFCYTYPIAVLLFAVTMLLTVLLRDSAKTVLLAIWVGLLIYFLPLLTGHLEWMNIFEQMDDTRRGSVIANAMSLKLRKGYEDLSFVNCMRMAWDQTDNKSFWQYIRFLGFAAASSISCVVLAIIAVKRRWHWRPGQKTIAWTLGISAAFIYGVSIFQAGYNLQAATLFQGKEINSKISLLEQSPNVFNWTGEELSDVFIEVTYNPSESALCFQDDLAFRVRSGHPRADSYHVSQRNKPVEHYFILDTYQFPYKERASIPLSEVCFFVTPPVARNWTQHVVGSFVYEHRLYIAYRPVLGADSQIRDSRFVSKITPLHLLVVDVSDPANPRRIYDEVIAQPEAYGGSMAAYGDYLYINDGEELIILSLQRSDQPQIIKRVNASDFGIELERYRYPPNSISVVVNDKLIFSDGARILIFSLSEPLNPKVIYYELFRIGTSNDEERIQAVAYSDKDGLLFVSTRKDLTVHQLTPGPNGKLIRKQIGRRAATPIEHLAGRRPKGLLLHKGFLVENAGSFGLLVYDITDPTRLKRAYHAGVPSYVSNIGIWNGLIVMENYYTEWIFLDIPRRNHR